MQLSIVSTLYRSSPYLREFHARASAAARRFLGPGGDFEIVLVNDGSPDDALAVALELQAGDPHLRIVDLSRNFGHHQAMWIGLQHARGDDVFLIDCDLQEAPEWLHDLEQARQEAGADVAFGVQDTRGGSWLERWGGWLSYKLVNALADHPLPQDLMTVRIMSRRYVDALLSHEEVSFTIAGLWVRTGFSQVPVRLSKQARRGQTTYNLLRRTGIFVKSLTSFSSVPLILSFYLGAALIVISTLVACGLVVRQLFITPMMSGWPSLMVSIWMLGGVILFCQGLQGLYLARIYQETKRRPIAIVRKVHDPRAEASHDPIRLAR